MPKIEQYAAREVFDPPTYSQAVKVTGGETILYLAGQVAYDDKGGVAHPGDFKAQARAALQAVKAQVEAGGGTMANIVKVNTYLTDIRHRADYAPDPRGVLRQEQEDAGEHPGRGHRIGAARVPDRDRGDRGTLGRSPHRSPPPVELHIRAGQQVGLAAPRDLRVLHRRKLDPVAAPAHLCQRRLEAGQMAGDQLSDPA